ncbi:MAG: hypothetical protein RLO12_18770 [Fulvivirga sp.]
MLLGLKEIIESNYTSHDILQLINENINVGSRFIEIKRRSGIFIANISHKELELESKRRKLFKGVFISSDYEYESLLLSKNKINRIKRKWSKALLVITEGMSFDVKFKGLIYNLKYIGVSGQITLVYFSEYDNLEFINRRKDPMYLLVYYK